MTTCSFSKKRVFSIFLCLFFLFVSTSFSTEKNHHVLIISSYHIGYGGADRMLEGIRKEFSKHNMDVDFYFEFLDSKRFSPGDLFPAIEKLYQKKFYGNQFDIIIVADNNALNFIFEVRDKIFPNTPVVFCGINNYQDSMIENMSLITGVTEDISLKETIFTALDFHPETTHLGVISDSTTTGKANLSKFKQIAPSLPKQLNIIDLGNLSAGELVKKLEGLPERTVLLQLSFYMDAQGRQFTQKEQMELILKHCDKPIYSAWDFFIAYGVVGGIVTHFSIQGETAANMAIQVINGKPISQIPVIKNSPNVPVFDYMALKQHALPLSALPPESIVLNRPQTFYHQNKVLVWSVVFFLAIQSVIIGALIITIQRRKQTERRLIQYERIVSGTSDLMSFVDHKYVYQAVNEAYLVAHQKETSEIVGNSIPDLMGPEIFEDAIKENIDRCLCGETVNYQSWFNYTGIGKRFMDVTYHPVRPKNSNSNGIVVCAHDLTDLKHAENKHKELQSKLLQAQKMEAIGTLAGGIAHDFNNILFPILGYSEMLLADIPNDSPLREGLKEIHKGAVRAKDLVQQILTFARQEKHEINLMKIQPILKEVLKLIRSTIPTTIEIKQDIYPKCGSIKADPTQIHQIIMNLATNAYQAMEENGGFLKVTLKEEEIKASDEYRMKIVPGDYACLTIADTGTGMNKEVVEKIFDPFFTTKEKNKGTGMGLSVVHGIVEKIGGTIQVQSRPGKGTKFTVYFPIETSSSEKKDNAISVYEFPSGTEQVLLVDDEESIIDMVEMMLKRLGYKVKSEVDPTEALKTFKASPNDFDLVITDRSMPKMPGEKLVSQLLMLRQDLPIIMCTGYSDKFTEQMALDIGIKDFIMKPILLKELSEKIRNVLNEAGEEIN